jgi:RimJ/RimL family protein N-acetyltransferase
MVRLEPVEWGDAWRIAGWRKVNPEGARTPFMLNGEQQDEWFAKVVCDRHSPHRYWSVWDDQDHIGLTGITNMEHENRRGEIALLVDPEKRGRGYGKQALWLALWQAFDNMDLEQVYGEAYYCNKYLKFWQDIIVKYNLEYRELPSTKRWAGTRWDSLWFAIAQRDWKAMRA